MPYLRETEQFALPSMWTSLTDGEKYPQKVELYPQASAKSFWWDRTDIMTVIWAQE